MPDWPQQMQPVAGGDPVEVWQHTPLGTAALLDWCGGEQLFINGGPVILLPGSRRCADRLVGLGDYVVHDDTGYRAEPADGFYQRIHALPESPAAA